MFFRVFKKKRRFYFLIIEKMSVRVIIIQECKNQNNYFGYSGLERFYGGVEFILCLTIGKCFEWKGIVVSRWYKERYKRYKERKVLDVFKV